VKSTSNVSITSIRPGDAAALAGLFDWSSPATRCTRLHGTVGAFPPSYFDDIARRAPGVIARVARDLTGDPSGACIIALASASLACGHAELGVWVVDPWQRQGIGSRVARAVLEELRDDGIPAAVAYVEPDNHAAFSLAQRAARDLDLVVRVGPTITFQLHPVGELTA
jgi:GNAT superfamily N-acetyltransferase